MRSAGRIEHDILGQLLRDLRIQQGLNQRQFAERIGRTHGFVGKVERGYQHIDIATLIDWAESAGADPGDIVRQVRSEAKHTVNR